METFRLYAFSDGRSTVISRGTDQNMVSEYLQVKNVFPRGVGFFEVPFLPLNAAKLYERDHQKGWLHRPPRWLSEKRRTEYEESRRKLDTPKATEEQVRAASEFLRATLAVRRRSIGKPALAQMRGSR